MPAAEVIREDLKRGRDRVEFVAQEVNGERLLSRNMLKQARQNGDDLAALKTHVDRIEDKVDRIETEMRGFRSDLNGLRSEFNSSQSKVSASSRMLCVRCCASIRPERAVV